MRFINRKTKQYPISQLDIQNATPNVSYPIPFNPGEDYAEVKPSPVPACNTLVETIKEVEPKLVNGEYIQQWEVVALTDDEIASNMVSVKLAMWDEIQQKRSEVKEGGVQVGGKWFHTDDASRIQYIGMLLLGEALPEGVWWKTMDTSVTTMTPALAKSVVEAVAALDYSAFAVAETHRKAMEASDRPDLYDFNDGWPESFAA